MRLQMRRCYNISNLASDFRVSGWQPLFARSADGTGGVEAEVEVVVTEPSVICSCRRRFAGGFLRGGGDVIMGGSFVDQLLDEFGCPTVSPATWMKCRWRAGARSEVVIWGRGDRMKPRISGRRQQSTALDQRAEDDAANQVVGSDGSTAQASALAASLSSRCRCQLPWILPTPRKLKRSARSAIDDRSVGA